MKKSQKLLSKIPEEKASMRSAEESTRILSEMCNNYFKISNKIESDAKGTKQLAVYNDENYQTKYSLNFHACYSYYWFELKKEDKQYSKNARTNLPISLQDINSFEIEFLKGNHNTLASNPNIFGNIDDKGLQDGITPDLAKGLELYKDGFGRQRLLLQNYRYSNEIALNTIVNEFVPRFSLEIAQQYGIKLQTSQVYLRKCPK